MRLVDKTTETQGLRRVDIIKNNLYNIYQSVY